MKYHTFWTFWDGSVKDSDNTSGDVDAQGTGTLTRADTMPYEKAFISKNEFWYLSEISATKDWPFGVAQLQARFSCETIKSDNSFWWIWKAMVMYSQNLQQEKNHECDMTDNAWWNYHEEVFHVRRSANDICSAFWADHFIQTRPLNNKC